MNFLSLPPSVRMYHLSDLLPYDISTKKCQKKELEEYFLLLCAAKNLTIGLLEKRKLKKIVDPIVGENLCQARALQVALLVEKCIQSFGQIKDEIDFVFNEVKELLKNSKKSSSQNFDELFKSKIDIKLSEVELLFIQFYLLTVVKKKEINIPTHKTKTLTNVAVLNYSVSDFEKLREVPKTYGVNCELSKRFLECLRSKLQKNISESSSQLMIKLAGEGKISRILPVKRTEKGLFCTPFYGTTLVFLNTALHYKIPIVLWVQQKDGKDLNIVRNICVSHQSKKNGDQYKPKAPHYRDANTLAIVVKGIAVRNWEFNSIAEITYHELAEYPVKDIVLANASKHRQLPKNTLKNDPLPVDTDQDLQFHSQLAEQWKCSDKDPSLFFVNHVYCERLGNIKPIRFDVDSFLEEHYADFYYDKDRRKIERLASELNIEFKVSLQDSQTMIITLSTEDDLKILMDKLDQSPSEVILFHNKISSFCLLNHHYISLEKDLQTPRLLELARSFPNPIKFLIDHKFYWPVLCKNIVDFLCEKPENFDQPDLMDMFADDLIHRKFYSIQALGHALKSPKYKKRATNLLLNESIHSGIFRAAARKELAQLINEPLIREHFEKMLQKEPIMQFSLELETYLENMGPYMEILDRLLSSKINTNGIYADQKSNNYMKIDALFSIINDQNLETPLRIVAMRQCTEYFLNIEEINSFHMKNFVYMKKICQKLRHVSEKTLLNESIINESKKITKLIIFHLYEIERKNKIRYCTAEFYLPHLQLIELLETAEERS